MVIHKSYFKYCHDDGHRFFFAAMASRAGHCQTGSLPSAVDHNRNGQFIGKNPQGKLGTDFQATQAVDLPLSAQVVQYLS